MLSRPPSKVRPLEGVTVWKPDSDAVQARQRQRRTPHEDRPKARAVTAADHSIIGASERLVPVTIKTPSLISTLLNSTKLYA
jgi:hypothetical protein